jgi:hypothetical protein
LNVLDNYLAATMYTDVVPSYLYVGYFIINLDTPSDVTLYYLSDTYASRGIIGSYLYYTGSKVSLLFVFDYIDTSGITYAYLGTA